MDKLNKRAQFGLLQVAAIAFVTVTVLLVVGSNILTDVQADQTADSFAYNTTQTGLESLNDLGSNLTTIATVVGAVILLGFLGIRLFGGRR